MGNQSLNYPGQPCPFGDFLSDCQLKASQQALLLTFCFYLNLWWKAVRPFEDGYSQKEKYFELESGKFYFFSQLCTKAIKTRKNEEGSVFFKSLICILISKYVIYYSHIYLTYIVNIINHLFIYYVFIIYLPTIYL